MKTIDSKWRRTVPILCGKEGHVNMMPLHMGKVLSIICVTRTGIASDAVLLFSESNTRFVVEVEPDKKQQFEAQFADLPLVPLGRVQALAREERLLIRAVVPGGSRELAHAP